MRVLLVSAVRDEAPHLPEWIAHHRALGVTDFLIFSNDCGDGTDAMLDAMAPLGVTHLPNRPAEGKSVQWNALKQAWGHPLREQAEWILGIDSDEFVNLRAPLGTLQDLVGAVGEAEAVVLPWRIFGSNGQRRLTDAPTTQTFTRAAPPGCGYPVGGLQFKTLFRRDGPFARPGVHRPRNKKGQAARWVDGSGRALPGWFAENDKRITLFGLPEGTALVQLNHYSLRSAQSFMLKRLRGLPNRTRKAIDLMYWVERNFNTVEDLSIARHAPAVRAALDEVMGLPGMARLHAEGLAWHHARFEEMMRTEAELRLYGRLLLAADSMPLPGDDIRELVSRFQALDG